MRICFDTEFIEDGRTIDLISIGMVREDGMQYYAELEGADFDRANEFVLSNVVPHLTGATQPPLEVAEELIDFAGEEPEFWAWYADYDWVALCQIFGRMLDLPAGWPKYCRDFKQVKDGHGLVLPKHDVTLDGPEHHALSDARWLHRAMNSVQWGSVVDPGRQPHPSTMIGR